MKHIIAAACHFESPSLLLLMTPPAPNKLFILQFPFIIRFFPAKYHILNMASLTTHFARRGLELAHGALAGKDDQKIKASPLATLVLVITCLIFFALVAAVSRYLTY